MNISIHKLVSITAYGAAVVTSESVGLIGLYKKTFPLSPDVFSQTVCLVSAALCTKAIHFHYVVSVV